MSGTHAKEVGTHRRLCVDGEPHLSFFDRRTGLEFCWTGRYDQPIEVMAGDEVTNLIEYTANGHRPLIPLAVVSNDIIRFFGEVCIDWLLRIEADIHAEEPRMVREVE